MMFGLGLLPRLPNSCHSRVLLLQGLCREGQDKFCIPLPALLILAISLPLLGEEEDPGIGRERSTCPIALLPQALPTQTQNAPRAV